MTTNFNDPSFLRLSVQRALVGSITANMAALHAQLEEKQVSISVYFFHGPTDEDKEHAEEAAGYVMADFPDSYTLETQYGLVTDIKLNAVEWNFLRAEAYSIAVRE